MKKIMNRFFFRLSDFFRYSWRNTLGKINVIFWFLISALNGMTTVGSISMGKPAVFNIFFLAIWMPGILYWNYRMYKKARAKGAKVKLAGQQFYNEWGEFDVRAAEKDIESRLKEMEDLVNSKNISGAQAISNQVKIKLAARMAAIRPNMAKVSLSTFKIKFLEKLKNIRSKK